MYKLQLVITTGRKKMKIGRKLLMLYFKNLCNKDHGHNDRKKEDENRKEIIDAIF